MTGAVNAVSASPNSAKQIQFVLKDFTMTVANATDVPNLLLRLFPRIAAIFDSFNLVTVMFFAPCGQKPSLTNQTDIKQPRRKDANASISIVNRKSDMSPATPSTPSAFSLPLPRRSERRRVNQQPSTSSPLTPAPF